MNKRILKGASALVAATMIASGAVALSYTPAAASTRMAAVVAQAETEKGVLIARVEANGPAAKAGLRRGDIVLSVNGKAVNDVQALRSALSELKPGADIKVVVDRGGSEQTLTVTLGDRDGGGYLGVSPAIETATPTESPNGSASGSTSGDEAGNNGSEENQVIPAPETAPASPDEPMKPMTRTMPAMPGQGMPFGRAFGQVSVTGVVTGSPAEKAGLKIGDVISAVDGQTLSPRVNLSELIAAKKPGDTVTLTVNSGVAVAKPSTKPSTSPSGTMTSTVESGTKEASARTVTVTLGTNPDKAGVAWLGIQYRPAFMIMTEGMGPGNMPSPRGRRVPGQTPGQTPGQGQGSGQAGQAEQGAFVASVVSDSPASKAGLAERDLIVEVNGSAVGNAEAVVKAVQALKVGDVMTLTVMRGNERQDIKVTLGDNPNAAGKPYLGVELGTFSIQMQPGGQSGAQEGGLVMPFELDTNGMPNLDDLLNQLRERMPDAVPAIPSTPGTTQDGSPSQGNL